MRSGRVFVRTMPVLMLLALLNGCGGGSGGEAGSSPSGSGALSGTQPASDTGSNTGSNTGGDTAVTPGGTTGGTTAVGSTNILSNGNSSVTNGSLQPSSASTAAKNLLAITVNGSLCSNNSYPNKPCVSVTVCTPGTSNCQTVNDILLDTGSYGLRIFRQAMNLTLPQVGTASGSIAECVQFGDGSSMWGPVQTASVVLGGEPAVQVPIQVVDFTFGKAPDPCDDADQSPAEAGFNGILGVGLFAQDCGSRCTDGSINNRMYYSCSGSTCNGTAVALASQVQNPVSQLPEDNNGVIVQLPAVPPGGSTAVNGYLVLGIGTQANNVPPAGVTKYAASQSGEFTARINGISYDAFIDSGSNGLFFSSSSILKCGYPYSAWYCPSAAISLSATNTGYSGTPSNPVTFQIGNYLKLMNSSNQVFSELGGNLHGGFDWGLPFHLGRDVYVGLSDQKSSLGTGPYWAY